MRQFQDLTHYLESHEFLDDFALAYHRQVSARICRDSHVTLDHARRTLARWMRNEAFDQTERRALCEWERILEGGDPDEIVAAITQDSDRGQQLRQSSPFAGLLSDEERAVLMRECEERARHLLDAAR